MPKAKSNTDNDIDALRAELEAARGELATVRGQRDTAAAEAREAKLARMSAEERALVSALEATEGSIAAMTAELDTAEAEIARLADEPGNGAAIAKLNRQMSATSARLQTAEQRKEFLEGKQEELKTRAAPRTDTPASGEDRVLANGSKLSVYPESTQKWLLDHPQAFTDRRFMQKAVAAAMDAVAEGKTEESADYFAHIEDRLGLRADDQHGDEDDQGDEDGDDVATDPPQQRQTGERYEPEKPQHRAAGPGSMAAAPTRQVPSGNSGGNRRTPALTAEEREVADSLYAGKFKNPADRYKHYADNKKIMDARDASHFRSH